MASKAEVKTTLHEDGAISHMVDFGDNERHLFVIKASNPLLAQFAAHGSRAKVLAAINSAKDVADAKAKVKALDEAFEAHRWTMNEGTAKPKGTLLARALAALKERPLEEIEAKLKGMSRADQAKLRGTPEVMGKIAELEADARTEAGGSLLESF